MGLLYKEAGDKARAQQYFERALQTWKNADASYKPAAEARQALASL